MAKQNEVVLKLTVDGKQAQVVLQATDRDIQKLAAGLKGVQSSAGMAGASLVNSMTNARNVLQGVQASFDAINSVFGAGIRKAQDYELQMAIMEGAISSNGGAAGVTAGEMEKLATSISKNTMFSKLDAIQAEQMLLTYDKISGDTMPKAMDALSGVAYVMKTDLKSASMQLGMVLQNPADGMRQLRSMGIKLSDAEKDLIKTTQDTNGVQAAQAVVLDMLSRKFGDINDAVKGTDAFAINQLEKAVAALGKEAGKVQAHFVSQFLPTITDLTVRGLNANKTLGGLVITVTQLGAAYALLTATGVMPLIFNFGLMGLALKAAAFEFTIVRNAAGTAAAAMASARIAADGFKASMGPIGWLVLGVGSLVTVMGLLADKTQEVKEEMDQETKSIKSSQLDYLKLADIVKDSTKAYAVRQRALDDLKKNHKDYISQTVTLESKDLKEALNAGTLAYVQAVDARIAAKEYDVAREKELETEKLLNQKRLKFLDAQAEQAKQIKETGKSGGPVGDWANYWRSEYQKASDVFVAAKKEADAALVKVQEKTNTKTTRYDFFYHKDPDGALKDAERFAEEARRIHEERLLGEEQAALNAVDREAELKKAFLKKAGVTEAMIAQWVEDEKAKIRKKYDEERLKESKKYYDELRKQIDDDAEEFKKKEKEKQEAEEKRLELVKRFNDAQMDHAKLMRETRISMMRNEYDQEIANAETLRDERRMEEGKRLSDGLISYQQYVDAKDALDKDFEAKKSAIEEKRLDASLKLTAGNLTTLAGLFGEHTVAYKALSIAAVTMDSIQAAMAAYKSTNEIPIVGPFMAPIMAAAAGAFGAKKIAEISGVSIPGFAEGGFALTGENGPEIIAPVETYAQGQAALISAVTSRLGYVQGGNPGATDKIVERLDAWNRELVFAAGNDVIYTAHRRQYRKQNDLKY